MTIWEDLLEEDLEWREAELASLKLICILNSQNKVAARSTIRAAWAMLYAHYEGFTKFCWDLLLDNIQDEKVLVEKLNEKFRILGLEKHFRNMRGNLSSPELWDFYSNVLPNQLKTRVTFFDDCRLETKSNLWPHVFDKECLKIGIISTELDNHRNHIQALVSRRNEIAHGQKMIIKSIQEYTEFENATLLVLHDLAIQVLDILEKKTYLKA